MVEYRKYIFRIIVFVLVIFLFAISFQERLIVAFNHNKELNTAIIAIFLIGIIYILKNIILMHKEENWLNNYLIGKINSTKYTPNLLKDLSNIFETNKTIIIPPNIAKENIARITLRLDGDREIIKYITALLIFLGLLGTFWGLLLTIDSVGITISNMSIDEENILTNFISLKEGLKAPLEGMGIAFSSSLYGLAGSLCIGFVDLQCNRAQNDFLENLEKKIVKYDIKKTVKIDNVGIQYTEAVLHQTVEGIEKLQKSLQKSESARENYEKLIVEITSVISKINSEINIRLNQYNKSEIANIENLRNIDENIKLLKEEIQKGDNNQSQEIAKEIQVLAKTISLIKK